MEGPEIAGPPVWLELNKKNEAKIIGFIVKNKVNAHNIPFYEKPVLLNYWKLYPLLVYFNIPEFYKHAGFNFKHHD